MSNVNTIRVYACGGLGLNVVGNHLADNDNEAGDEESGFAAVDVAYMDTSTANVTSIMDNKFYHFRSTEKDESGYKLLEGGGKDRAKIAKAVDHWANHALERHPPKEFNIVVHSLTGASGSVVAPILVRRLLEAGKSVIVLAALTDTSLQELDNAKGTIGTYESMAKLTNSPVVIKTYTESNQLITDQLIISDLAHLRGLFSGVNQAMDTMDLKNWLKYSGKSVKMQPRMYALDIYGGNRVMTEPALSVAALASSNTIVPPVPVAYLTTGIPPQSWFEGDAKLIDKNPVFYAISDKAHEVYERINTMVKDAAGKFSAPRDVKRAIDVSDADNDTGIVF